LVERSLGTFEPEEKCWNAEGPFKIDPFRPNIQPKGFSSENELIADRKIHLGLVKHLLQSADVFIFTLGLTESWRAKADGAVFPLCPGCPHGEFDSKKYEFHNFSVQELIDDLKTFMDLLKAINPVARVIFTVSPVPLIATMDGKHVLRATVASKSALRASADEVCKLYSNATYFGSYEIVQHTFKSDQYFGPDRRSVVPEAVERVMKTFFGYFAPGESLIEQTKANLAECPPAQFLTPVCDEDQLSEAIGNARVIGPNV
jgi:hypothetical protein